MINAIQLFVILIAGASVAIADALIKKSAATGSYLSALKNPLILAASLIYIFQILLFLYIFINKWHLGIVGVLQMVFYSFTVILLGLLIFGESISLIQGIGIALALAGVILINL